MQKLIYLGRIEDVFDITERGIALLLDEPLSRNLAGSSVVIKRPGAACREFKITAQAFEGNGVLIGKQVEKSDLATGDEVWLIDNPGK